MPWALGSGKSGAPCLRMQAANFTPCVALPRSMKVCPPRRGPGDAPLSGDPPPPLGLCVVVAPVVVAEATLATRGEPPPHPARAVIHAMAAASSLRPCWR